MFKIKILKIYKLEKLNKHLQELQFKQNNRGISNFEGYSPIEIDYVFYDTFGMNSPVHLRDLSDSDLKKIPLLNQICRITGFNSI